MSWVLLHDCRHNFAEGREHLAKLIITCAVGQILNEDVRVDFVHVDHCTLILAFVEHNLQRLVMEQLTIHFVDSILGRFLVIELDKTEALTLTVIVTLKATRNDGSVL